MIESVQSLLFSDDDEGEDPLVVILAIASFIVNTSAAGYFGTINLRTCHINAEGASMSILSDLISSAAVVVTSWIRLKFGIAWLDPFMSLLISAMIFTITVNEMIPLVIILLQTAPSFLRIRNFVKKIAPGDSAANGHAWLLDSEQAVVTMAFTPVSFSVQQTMLGRIREVVGECDWSVELAQV
jgi:Co/Zn/Cd efflux system component